MADKFLFTIFVIIGVTSIQCGEYCTKLSDDWWVSSERFWCENGCCGSSYDKHCCVDDKSGMIIGIVVGSLVLVGVIISILVAVFCCCRKSPGRTGQVYQPPNTQAGITIPMQNFGYGQAGYSGAVNHTVVTSNMTPGSVQTWQQPPPAYDQLNTK